MGGSEAVVDQSFRGFTIQMEVHFAVVFGNLTKSEDRMEPVIDAIIQALEADVQVTPAGGTPLANWCYYKGLEFFQSEAIQGEGGIQLTYLVQYRRPLGITDQSY
jgi:hypothetical protein